MLDVVATDQRHVVGYRHATFTQGLHRTDHRHVVDRKDRRRQALKVEYLLHGAIAADPIDRRAKHQFLTKRDAGSG